MTNREVMMKRFEKMYDDDFADAVCHSFKCCYGCPVQGVSVNCRRNLEKWLRQEAEANEKKS